MSFTIPNQAQSIQDPLNIYPQAAPDKIDIDMLVQGINGYGIVTGAAVTPQGSPNMTVAVAAGTAFIQGTSTIVTITSGNVTITAANASFPRFDLVAVDNTGTKSAVAGTASANPVFPSIPANSIILAAVYVAAGVASIVTSAIVDKRCVLNIDIPWFRKTGEVVDAFTQSTATMAIDLSLGNVKVITMASSVTTINITNTYATGISHSMTWRVTQDGTGGRTLTFPASFKWAGGVAPTQITTLNTTSVYSANSVDGGTTWLAFVGGLAF